MTTPSTTFGSTRLQQLSIIAVVLSLWFILLFSSTGMSAYFFFSIYIDQHSFSIVWFVVLLIALIGEPILLTITIWRLAGWFAKQTFDPLFASLGLTAASYLGRGRQYHGNYRGQVVDIFLLPIQIRQISPLLVLAGASTASLPVYAGHRLEIFVAGHSRTRAVLSGVHQTFPVNQATQLSLRFGQNLIQALPRQTIDLTDPALAGCTASAIDAVWFEQLLQNPKFQTPLHSLVSIKQYAYSYNLQIQPDYYSLQTRINKRYLTANFIQHLIDDLLQLGSITEASSQPTITDQATGSEFNLRKDRSKLTRWAIVVMLTLLVMLLLFIGAAIMLIGWYESTH